jgi:hypothetical protein
VGTLLAKLDGVRKAGKGWSARCPAHDDRKASLSVTEGDDGTVLVKCHAGCDTAAVVSAIGLTVADLFPPKPGRNGTPRTGGRAYATAKEAVAELERRYGQRSATWTYHDTRGEPAGLVVRWDTTDEDDNPTKDIRPVAWVGDGWRIAAMPDPRPLYGLPALAAARRVVVTEGEKAADRARALGFVATTSAGGALAAAKTDWRPLAGKEVWILPDNDLPGRKYADTVAGTLAGLTPAAVVRVVALPGLPEGGDVVDWVEAHGDAAEPDGLRAEVEALAGAAPPWRPPAVSPTPDGPLSGVHIIRAYFEVRHRPLFKRGHDIYCADGTEVAMRVACALPDSVVIARLAAAKDAPRYKGDGVTPGPVNANQLPGFFNKWAKVAWGDLLLQLPDEDEAELGQGGPAPEEFRRMVRDVLVQEVVLGDVIKDTAVTQTERNSLIGWCQKFARPGPWRTIRGKKCFCKLAEGEGGELTLKVAIRVELFAQVHADRRLRAMTANTFTRRAEKYGVGLTSRRDRPHGVSAVVLAGDLIADLVAGIPDDDGGTDEPLRHSV